MPIDNTTAAIRLHIREHPRDVRAYEDMLEWLKHLRRQGQPDMESGRWLRDALAIAPNGAWATVDEMERLLATLRGSLILDARDDLDCFMQAMEFDRDPERRFWLPRRDRLMPLCRELQWLETSDEATGLLVACPPRVGKALAKDTPVLTREGWKRHGDLAIGDMVPGPDGRWHMVTAVMPDCEMQYRVTMSNGETVVCHGAHEWEIYDRATRQTKLVETRYLTTVKLITKDANSNGGTRSRFMLNIKEPLDGPDVDLPVHPYALGAWLGDGRNGNPDVCAHPDDVVVLDAIEACGYERSWEATHRTTGVLYRGFKSLRPGLQELGMCHSRYRVEKRIPDVYLTASLGQRLELLAGLLDTDGTLVKKEHRYHFTTSEPMLRDSFVALASTFGWRCSVKRYEPIMSTSGIQGRHQYWQIGFCPDIEIPCRVPRKRLTEFSMRRRVAIVSVEPVEAGILGNCISVEGGMYCVGNTLVQTHNSTTCGFAMSWHMGRHPYSPNLMTSYSDTICQHFFDQACQFAGYVETMGRKANKITSEYNYPEIFPESLVFDRSAQYETITLAGQQAYPTLTCRSIEGTLTGTTEVGEEGWLYADDLVKSLEESMSHARMEKKWQAYVNQAYDRRKEGAKLLNVGTIWSIDDPQSRVMRKHDGDPRYHSLIIPALDPKTGESNFEYLYGKGFSKQYYMDMRDMTDEVTWLAKYCGTPTSREGQLYPADSLQRYLTLPEGDPEAVMAVADTKDHGEDFCVVPVAKRWGGRWYITDVICDNGNPDALRARVAALLERERVQQCRFESNSAGGAFAKDVSAILMEHEALCSVTTKFTSSNKETRIIASSPWVLNNCLFRDPSLYSTGTDYDRFMSQMVSYTLEGKVPHDDAPDAMAMLADLLSKRARPKAAAIRRPF